MSNVEARGSSVMSAPAATGEFAGPMRRLVAWLIDWVIVTVLAVPVAASLGGLLGGLPVEVTAAIAVLAIWPIYGVVLVHGGGATLGRLALGIRVVSLEDGRPPGWGRSTVRVVLQLALVFVPLVQLAAPLNYASVLWHPRKQAWHDRIAGTIVVRARGADRLPAEPEDRELVASSGWSPPPPRPLSRRGRAVVLVLTVGALGVVGALVASVIGYLEDDLIDTDFRVTSEPFEVGQDARGQYDLVDGSYRIRPVEGVSVAGTLGDLRRPGYALGVQADVAEVTEPGVQVGLGCVGPSPESDDLAGYVLLVSPGGAFVLYSNDDRVRGGVDSRIGSVRRLSIVCLPDGSGGVLVTGFANGIEVVRHVDPHGPRSFTYAVLAAAGDASSEVRFTDVWARVPDERWTTDPPLDRDN